jgi:hypothetical protein
MAELVVAITFLQIIVINTKLRLNQMQQHKTDYGNPCIDFIKFVLSNGVMMRMVCKPSSGSI